jgi:RNA polymerase sigma factor (sigma-70 family)
LFLKYNLYLAYPKTIMEATERNTSLILHWDKFRKDGSRDSISRIYFECFDLLFNYGLKHTKDRQIVEDAIQNLFSYLLKVRKTLGPVNNIVGYLVKSLRNQLLSDLKCQGRHLFTDKIPEDSFNYFSSPEQIIIENENDEHINKVIRCCIDGLTSKQQEILFLRFDHGLSYEEIAAITGLTIESCHTTIYRTVKTIRLRIDKMIGENNYPVNHNSLRIKQN